jgi:hypothetical protein
MMDGAVRLDAAADGSGSSLNMSYSSVGDTMGPAKDPAGSANRPGPAPVAALRGDACFMSDFACMASGYASNNSNQPAMNQPEKQCVRANGQNRAQSTLLKSKASARETDSCHQSVL